MTKYELALLNSGHWVWVVWRCDKSRKPVGVFKSRIPARNKRRTEKENGYNGHIAHTRISEVA